MNRWKLNIASWYSLGLAAVLVILCLVVSVGVAWARYRTEAEQSIYFSVRKPVSVYLGNVEYSDENIAEETVAEEAVAEGKFVPANEGSWVINEEGNLQLKFAIANGTSQEDFEERTQQVSIRLIGSVGIQPVGEVISLKLTFPSEEEPEVFEQIEATATPIVPESPLYTTFGEGWVFCFEDADEELTWMLEGGALSYIEMDVTMEGGTLADTSLLQLQVSSRYISD